MEMLEHALRGVVQRDRLETVVALVGPILLDRPVAQRVPIARVRAQEQRDGRGSDHMSRSTRQSGPAHFTRQAQRVEPGRLVALEPRRQYVALPGARGQLETVELRKHRTQTLETAQAAPRLDVLPHEEEVHELGR